MNQQTVYQKAPEWDATLQVIQGVSTVVDFVKPTTGYFFTPEEFREVARDIYKAGYVRRLGEDNTCVEGSAIFPDFQTFYNQLIGKTTKEVLDNDTTPPKWGTAL